MTFGRQTTVAASLLGVALGAWVVAVLRMRGMDAGPGTDLGGLGWFLGIWVTMTAAMMLPSAAPAVLAFARLRHDASVSAFVAGYMLVWAACGLVAYTLYRVAAAAAPSVLSWDERGPWVAGSALAVGGLYHLTPLKSACLRHCRSPVHLLLTAKFGGLGAVRTGAGHGVYCVGCCAGLMLALFALGVMSLVWMAAVAGAVLLEKTLPGGEAFSRSLSVVLVTLGIWVAVAPMDVPGVDRPTEMRMQR